MKKNMSTVDSIVRILIAGIITALYFTNVINSIFATALLVLAGILVLTSFIRICPLYLPFGISTCGKKE